MANRWGNRETVTNFIFLGSKITADSDCSLETKRHLLLGRKAMTNWDNVLKSRDVANKGSSSQSYGFSSSHVWIWELDDKEGWVSKNWCFSTVRRLFRVIWTARRSNQLILQGNQTRIFIGRTDAETKAPILWPPDVKSWLTGKDHDAEKDWGQEDSGW